MDWHPLNLQQAGGAGDWEFSGPNGSPHSLVTSWPTLVRGSRVHIRGSPLWLLQTVSPSELTSLVSLEAGAKSWENTKPPTCLPPHWGDSNNPLQWILQTFWFNYSKFSVFLSRKLVFQGIHEIKVASCWKLLLEMDWQWYHFPSHEWVWKVLLYKWRIWVGERDQRVRAHVLHAGGPTLTLVPCNFPSSAGSENQSKGLV